MRTTKTSVSLRPLNKQANSTHHFYYGMGAKQKPPPSFHLSHQPRMGPKTSGAKPPTPTPTETKAVILPQDIIDEILDYLATGSDLGSLRSCALVSRSWVPSCRRHLFHVVHFTPVNIDRWLKTFPVPEDSPAHHVRDLRFSIGGDVGAHKRFSEYTPRFTNVDSITLLGYGGFQQLWILPFGRLPQSVTSLTVDTDGFTPSQVQGVMAQLPNLNDLSISGHLIIVDAEDILQGRGAVLRGRFGGRLRFSGHHTCLGVVDMLLEVPTGLHFTEMSIFTPHDCLLHTVRLAEACGKTLVKLTYTVSSHCKPTSSPSLTGCSLLLAPTLPM